MNGFEQSPGVAGESRLDTEARGGLGDERRLDAILEDSDVEFVAVEARGVLDRRLAARAAAWDRIFDEQGVRVYRRVSS